jgi:2-dehydro-3-deoxyphosphogalactonate aldolase
VLTGLIAILRGLTPANAAPVGETLYALGFRTLEVPLNSPEPLASLSELRERLPVDCMVGAGTVLTVAEARAVHDAGGQLVVSPNTDAVVIQETRRLGMTSCPGSATPTEALSALAAGATAVKVFPAQQVGPRGLTAWLSVLPQGVSLLPVGGIDPRDFGVWTQAGATGFGLGTSLFAPGIGVSELEHRARYAMSRWHAVVSRVGDGPATTEPEGS